MAKTYITFGQGHAHRVNNETFDCNSVAVIECENASDGRAKAFEYFGPKFCFEYHEDQFDHSSMRFFPRGLINAN